MGDGVEAAEGVEAAGGEETADGEEAGAEVGEGFATVTEAGAEVVGEGTGKGTLVSPVASIYSIEEIA